MKKITTIVLVFTFIVSFIIPDNVKAQAPLSVNMLSTFNFSVLSKAGITNTGSHGSLITGNIGSSPITAAAMSTVFCSEITGNIYGVDAAYVGSGDVTCFKGNPPSANKTLIDNAILDVGTIYNDLVGRTLPDGTELYAGSIGGQTFTPGLYKWSSDVSISSDVVLSGGQNDIWIFQIAGDLNMASAGSLATGSKILLSGGAKASNVFWQVGGVTGATLGTYSTFNGNLLTAKAINIQTGSMFTGRAFAQTEVTLDVNNLSLPVTNNPNGAMLKVDSIETLDGTAIANGQFENGWKYAFNITLPTTETHLAMKFADWKNSNLENTILVSNNMRISSAQADNNGARVMINGAEVYTNPVLNMITDLDSQREGIQVRVIVEVAIPIGTSNDSYATNYGVRAE